jgi:hypothetical protein
VLLKSREVKLKYGKKRTEYLVKWKEPRFTEKTWEREANLPKESVREFNERKQNQKHNMRCDYANGFDCPCTKESCMSDDAKAMYDEQFGAGFADRIKQNSCAGSWFTARADASDTVVGLEDQLRGRRKLRVLTSQVGGWRSVPASGKKSAMKRWDGFCNVMGTPTWEGCISGCVSEEELSAAGIRDCGKLQHKHGQSGRKKCKRKTTGNVTEYTHCPPEHTHSPTCLGYWYGVKDKGGRLKKLRLPPDQEGFWNRLADTGRIHRQTAAQDKGLCGCHFVKGVCMTGPGKFKVTDLNNTKEVPPIQTPNAIANPKQKVDQDPSKLVSNVQHGGLTKSGRLLKTKPTEAANRAAESAAAEAKADVQLAHNVELSAFEQVLADMRRQHEDTIAGLLAVQKENRKTIRKFIRSEKQHAAERDALEEQISTSQADLMAIGGTHRELLARHHDMLKRASLDGQRQVHEQVLAHYKSRMQDLEDEAEEVERNGDVDRLERRKYRTQIHSVGGVKSLCLAAEGVDDAMKSHTWTGFKAMLHPVYKKAKSDKSTAPGWVLKFGEDEEVEKGVMQKKAERKAKRIKLDGIPGLAPHTHEEEKAEEENDRSILLHLRAKKKDRDAGPLIVGAYLQKTVQQQTKEKRVVATFFNALEVTNQRVSFQQDSVFRITSGGMTENGKGFAASMGTFGSTATQSRRTAKDKATYRDKVNNKVSGWCEKVKAGEKVNIQVWTDDYTRLTILQRFVAAAHRDRDNYWTTIAAKATELIPYHQPRHLLDAGGRRIPHLNPVGFTVSTIDDVLSSAGPGSETFFDYANRLLPGSTTTEGARQRIRVAHYSQADLADKLRSMRGAQVLELAMHPFKSYGEFGRALLVLLSNKGLQGLLEGGCIIFLLGDWPAATFQQCLANQGWNWGGLNSTRTPEHAGRLMYQCTQDCTHANIHGDHELWNNYMRSIGLDPKNDIQEGWRRCGLAVRNIVTINGPLHVFLNVISDIGKHHRDTFIARFYKCWVGKEFHATPKVRQVVCVCEMLMCAWAEIRSDTLPLLEDCAKRTGQRFDLTAFVYFFEHHLPLALLSYSVMLREGVVDAGPNVRPANPPPYGGATPTWGTDPPQGNVPAQSADTDPGMGEARAWVQCLKHLCVVAHVRQRKNYTGALLGHLDKLNYWQRTNHPAYHVLYNHPEFYDEMWGETGIRKFPLPPAARLSDPLGVCVCVCVWRSG